jgi:peptidoglycan/xylan/chitin deacetylase (PgdA/CDA1 family)
MAPSSIVFLMYHELELPERKLVQNEAGYVRYILPVQMFRSQMEWLKTSGFSGLSVSEALLYRSTPAVCLTFDDGCETDLITAAPILQEFAFRATFYVTSGFLGTPGYLSSDQLRNLDSLGFEIGCHSMTHPYLSDLTDAELGREIIDAKVQIEQILGHTINHFSCPGGRYNRRTLETARRAGFRSVANSRFHANSHTTGHYELGRVALLRDTSLTNFATTCQGRGLWKDRLKDGTRQGVRQLLGNSVYDRMRATLLGEHR